MSSALPETLEVDDGEVDLEDRVATSPALVYHLEAIRDKEHNSISFTPKSDVSIGRDKQSCQLAFPEFGQLSRVHCRVFSMGRDVFVHDFSSNGTYINGKVMGKNVKRALRAGDVLAVLNPKLPDAEKFSWKFLPPSEEITQEDKTVTSVFELGPVLGTGNFATVRLGKSKKDGQKVAAKIIEKKRFALSEDEFSFSSLQHEVEILRKMQHRNIIGIVDVFDSPSTFTMVLDLVENGDLFDYVVGRSPSPFTESDARSLFVQLLEAMLYMHSKDVVHRDLKPENILIKVDPSFKIPNLQDDHQKNAPNIPVGKITLKITDFGLAKFCAAHEVMTTMCGTPSYLAPEVLTPADNSAHKSQGYSWAVDVWSLGVILYILLSGTPPKTPQSGTLVFNKFFNDISNEAKSLVEGMLKIDPRQRLDLANICTHAWLKGMAIEGKKLAVKHEPVKLEGTVLVKPSQAEEVSALGYATDVESDEDDDLPKGPPAKRKKAEVCEPMATKRIVPIWFWKCNLKMEADCPEAWQRYEDSAAIEKGYQKKGAKSCKVGKGDYRISFEGMFQYSVADTSRQRPVRREEMAAEEKKQ